MPPHHFAVGSGLTTLHVCSDGTYIYWVWSPVSLNEKTQKGHSVFMDVFQLAVGACYSETVLSRLFDLCMKLFSIMASISYKNFFSWVSQNKKACWKQFVLCFKTFYKILFGVK